MFVVASLLISCRSPQISASWVWVEDELPPSNSATLAARFQTHSETCTEQTEAIKGAARNRREAPRDAANQELLLDFDLDGEDGWNAVYERCMKSLGWKIR